MDKASVFCSSLEPRAATARELLLAALEDLSQDQLKRFRHKLRDAPVDGRSIPWGRLERADAVDLVDQLTHFYGPESALDVTRRTLKRADVRDVAARLKAQRLQQFQKKYREHVLQQHAKVRERNARSVKISQRFTKLLIAPESAAPREEEAALGPVEEREPGRAWRSDTHTFNRLFGSDAEGHRPLTVVLQGPAGIGKTMAAKKILYDWAAGKLYRGQVDFAFFLQCRELLDRPGARSLADLVLDQCPDRLAPVAQMLAQPQRLLFILDGARLLVTMRATASRKLHFDQCALQCAEVRGFSDKDKKKYFYKFFQEERRAERAYRFVKENETLFALCFVPAVCWIVCTVLRRQLELGRDLSRTSKTTTSVYLLFLASALNSMGAERARMRGELRKLCLLAREGILGYKAQFSERDMERLELRDSDIQHFLIKKELPSVLETEVIYQFIDQSFQEFFAALSYLLEDVGAPGVPTGGLETLLHLGSEGRSHLMLTTRFFFGLLNMEHVQDVERHFGCVVPAHVKQNALQWVQGQGHLRMAPKGADGSKGLKDKEEPKEEEEKEEEEEEELSFPLELLYCLYETQDEAFVNQALRSLPELTLECVHFSRMDLDVLSYCMKCCPAGQVLQLVSCSLVAGQEKKKKRSLLKRLKGNSQAAMKQLRITPLHPLFEAMTDQQCGLSSLTMSHCKLPDRICRDLSMALRAAPALTELVLLHCRLSEAGLRALSEGLAWPQCRVQTLRVLLLNPPEAFQYLVALLWQSSTLTTLDLSSCYLPDSVVTYLCAALQHPGCSLQTLSLASVELSEPSVQELKAVKIAKPRLAIVHPALNSHLGPPERVISAL
ncbi:NACHT, LRR and PYD domains-containing protein 6 [Fukomys damarensis]|uniref:NACHT, LRR and PYD domains-containing protein 6 n=1 Tax=Fukomys damarensis TaxID=885580 RepID=UPI0014552804|nr:NACHT, LRR and PYD domains-containing protein 6 [Fukomys damarensis]